VIIVRRRNASRSGQVIAAEPAQAPGTMPASLDVCPCLRRGRIMLLAVRINGTSFRERTAFSPRKKKSFHAKKQSILYFFFCNIITNLI
jgi:hypothetical protein